LHGNIFIFFTKIAKLSCFRIDLMPIFWQKFDVYCQKAQLRTLGTFPPATVLQLKDFLVQTQCRLLALELQLLRIGQPFNQLLYDFYGLTTEEIRIVEQR
jgi:hypothetical protein